MSNLTKADKIFNKTKISLMMLPDTLFYTTLLFSLKQTWNEKIPCARTNGRILDLNPDWFVDLSPDARIGLLMHEMLHVALQHSVRLNGRDPRIFNIAGDHVINLMLLDKGYTIPEHGHCNPKFKNMNTEQVYALVYEDEKDKTNGADDTGYSIPGAGADIDFENENNIEQATAEITDIVHRAATHAKSNAGSYGNVPGEVIEKLDAQINPKLPWNVILQNELTSYAKEDYSWRKANRRYMPDFYLPSAYSEAVGELCFAVDWSYSVRPHEFGFFINEIENVRTYLHPETLKLLTFDTKVNDIYDITENSKSLVDLEYTGRGGTDIDPVLKWGNENKPTVMLIFTDGDFYEPTVKPEYPIIWLIHDNPGFTSKFGKVIHYDIEAPHAN